MKATVTAGGGTYIEADANLSTEQQLTDVDKLISQGAKVLIMLAQDNKVILPAIQKAKDAGVPVIAYDRLIEDPEHPLHHVRQPGRRQGEAEAILAEVPERQLVLIKGDPGDPNASTSCPGLGPGRPEGQGRCRRDHDPADQFTDAWATSGSHGHLADQGGPGQHGSDLDKAVADGTPIDAILAENDSTALGVVGALTGELAVPAPERPGRRPRQPEQRRPGQPVRRRLQGRQRAGQDRGCRRARAVQTTWPV